METNAPRPVIPWRRSRRSVDNGNCVEVAIIENRVAIRDSKRPEDGHLTVIGTDWATVIGQISEPVALSPRPYRHLTG